MKHWDIFCKIVDNFGDIGVCWRLARQLHSEHDINIRLWIDDLHIAKQLIPELDPLQKVQLIENISIAAWDINTTFDQAANVVIEAFGCELPVEYMKLMCAESIWINLEYLSAEPWIEGFHARSSKRGDLTRHFFFPGFTEATGGLLREHDMIEKNKNTVTSQQQQTAFFQKLNLNLDKDMLRISLFSYPHAPISELLSAMADSRTNISCYVPATSILPRIADFTGKKSVTAGDHFRLKNLSLHVLPFLSQADYDKLLASCDINFVRGEDSWIRAIWAEKPFIWQPYLQTENTHLTKLSAFLNRFYAGCNDAAKQAAIAMHHAWTSEQMTKPVWQDYLSNIATLKTFTAQQSKALAIQTDLATNLVIYIEKLQHNHI